MLHSFNVCFATNYQSDNKTKNKIFYTKKFMSWILCDCDMKTHDFLGRAQFIFFFAVNISSSRLEKRESFHVKYCKNDGNKFPVKSQDPEITWYHLQTGPWLPGAGCLGEVSRDYCGPGLWDHLDKSGEKNKLLSHSEKSVGKQDWI